MLLSWKVVVLLGIVDAADSGNHWIYVWSPTYTTPLIEYDNVIEYMVGCPTVELIIVVVELFWRSILGIITGYDVVLIENLITEKNQSAQLLIILPDRFDLYSSALGCTLTESRLLTNIS